MTIIKFKYLVIFLFVPFFCISGQVKITGTAPGAEGKRIEVLSYGDLISFQEKNIADAMIDSLGNFIIDFDLDQTIFANLSIDFHRVEIFFQPSRNYQVKIEPMNYNEILEIDPFIQSAKLDLTFLEYDPAELNSLIQSFNIQYDDFLLKNYKALQDRNKAKLDTFTAHIESTFSNIKDPYLANYIKYKLAGLAQMSQTQNQAQIGKRYFSDAPILYMNVGYMDFFNQYFEKYILATSRALKFTDYKTMLEGAEPYKRIMKALESDTILRKLQLRELVMLKGLMEMYNSNQYDQGKIIELMKTVSLESKYTDNRNIAENMIRMLTKLRPGTAAPGFKLKTRELKEVTLADFKGKPVVMNFWTTYCQQCITEMDRMKPIYDKFKEKVAFISISTDKDFSKSVLFIKLKNDFVWNFLHIGDDYNLLKEYDVRSYPLFVLIDQNGNILQYPADLPGSGLELALQRLVNQ